MTFLSQRGLSTQGVPCYSVQAATNNRFHDFSLNTRCAISRVSCKTLGRGHVWKWKIADVHQTTTGRQQPITTEAAPQMSFQEFHEKYRSTCSPANFSCVVAEAESGNISGNQNPSSSTNPTNCALARNESATRKLEQPVSNLTSTLDQLIGNLPLTLSSVSALRYTKLSQLHMLVQLPAGFPPMLAFQPRKSEKKFQLYSASIRHTQHKDRIFNNKYSFTSPCRIAAGLFSSKLDRVDILQPRGSHDRPVHARVPFFACLSHVSLYPCRRRDLYSVPATQKQNEVEFSNWRFTGTNRRRTR